jgi:hypothetical protein
MNTIEVAYCHCAGIWSKVGQAAEYAEHSARISDLNSQSVIREPYSGREPAFRVFVR